MDLIVLFLLCRFSIAKQAVLKREKPSKWILITIGAWLVAEFTGFLLAILLLGTDNFIGISLIGFMSGLGGYLIVKAQLDKLPNDLDGDINNPGK